MTVKELQNTVIETITDLYELEEEVTLESDMMEDLSLSSMEIILLLGELETMFGVALPEGEISDICLVGDLCDVIVTLLRQKQSQ